MGVKLITSYKDRSANEDAYQQKPGRPSRSDMLGITRALRKQHNDGLKNLCYLQSSFRIIIKTGLD
jgi:hypothetical protein